MVFQDSTNLNNISKYIVDINGDTPYQTIQSALDAANTAGIGATVVVRPGTYTENLTLYDGIHIYGTTFDNVDIIGTHTPPLTGNFVVQNCTLTSGTDIFNSAAAGFTTIVIEQSLIKVTSGYLFNLLNWLGDLNVKYCRTLGTNDGFVNNTAGSTITVLGSSIGHGIGVIKINGGATFILGSSIDCPIDFKTGTDFSIDNCNIYDSITLSNNSFGYIANSHLETGTLTAINHNSTGVLTLSETIIDTTNAVAISGTGTIKIGSITYNNSTTRFGTITADRSTVLETGQIWATNIEDLKFTGFRSWGGAGTYYTLGALSFTLDRPGDGYIKGKLVSWLGGQLISLIPWAGQTAYIYIGPGGNIAATATRSVALFQDNIVLFEVLTDSAGTPNILVVKENHPYDFPTASSEWAHNTIGGVIDNAKNGANIALNGTKGIQINGQDTLLDHGLNTTIPDSSATAVNFNFMYTDGVGKWVLNTTQNTFPSDYNNAGTITALGVNKFGIFRLYVSKDDLNSSTPTYYTVYDDQEYNSLALAQAAIANNTPANATNEFFEIELAQLGFVVKQESTDTIASVIIQKSTVRGATTFATPTAASLINTDTSAFDSWLSGADTTVQAALNTLDEIGKGITTDPGAAGDSYVQFDINTTNEFRIGVDDDAADAFKISQGGALGTNDTFIMTAAGERTMPLQPAFLAHLSATATNVTGDGTNYTIICDTEIFDQNSDYNNATGIFTAPVTGRYQFNFSVRSTGITIGHTNGRIQLVTSNRTYTPVKLNYATGQTSSNDLTESGSLLADMDAGDTARVDIQISNGTLVIDIAGAADPVTYFSGALIC